MALDETKAEIAPRIRRCESTLTTGAELIDFMRDELG